MIAATAAGRQGPPVNNANSLHMLHSLVGLKISGPATCDSCADNTAAFALLLKIALTTTASYPPSFSNSLFVFCFVKQIRIVCGLLLRARYLIVRGPTFLGLFQTLASAVRSRIYARIHMMVHKQRVRDHVTSESCFTLMQ